MNLCAWFFAVQWKVRAVNLWLDRAHNTVSVVGRESLSLTLPDVLTLDGLQRLATAPDTLIVPARTYVAHDTRTGAKPEVNLETDVSSDPWIRVSEACGTQLCRLPCRDAIGGAPSGSRNEADHGGASEGDLGELTLSTYIKLYVLYDDQYFQLGVWCSSSISSVPCALQVRWGVQTVAVGLTISAPCAMGRVFVWGPPKGVAHAQHFLVASKRYPVRMGSLTARHPWRSCVRTLDS